MRATEGVAKTCAGIISFDPRRNLLYTGVTRDRDRHDDHPRQRNRAPALASYLSASAVSMRGRLSNARKSRKGKTSAQNFKV